jgi:hypothetical protein
MRGRPVAAVALGVVLSLLCSPHVTTEDFMLAVLPMVFIARRWPLIALWEAVAISAVEVVQLQLPAADQHLQPFLLTVIAASTVIAVRRRPMAPSTAPTQHRGVRLQPSRGVESVST